MKAGGRVILRRRKEIKREKGKDTADEVGGQQLQLEW